MTGHAFQQGNAEFTLEKGICSYTVVFNETIDTESALSDAELIKDKTVKTATYEGLNYNIFDLKATVSDAAS